MSKGLDTADKVWTWSERAWEVAKYFGVDGWVSLAILAVSAAVWGGILKFLSAVPWWLATAIGLLLAILLVHLYNRLRIAWALRGVRRLPIEELGADCVLFYAEYSDFILAVRQDPAVTVMTSSGQEDMHRQWQQESARRARAQAEVFKRFAPRIYALAHRLVLLGIPAPNLFHFPHGDHGGAGVYVAIAGELLKKGLLEDAKKLDPKITWGASIY